MDTSGAGERPEPVVLFRWPAWGVFFYAALMGFAGYGTILFGTLIYFLGDFGFAGFIMLVGTALIAFAVFLLGKSMRRWGLQRTLEKLQSRLRRGECLQCGYPMSLSAQEVCSECGWRHSHSLPIRTRSASERPLETGGAVVQALARASRSDGGRFEGQCSDEGRSDGWRSEGPRSAGGSEGQPSEGQTSNGGRSDGEGHALPAPDRLRSAAEPALRPIDSLTNARRRGRAIFLGSFAILPAILVGWIFVGAGVIARQPDILWVSRIASVVATMAVGAGHEEHRFGSLAPRYLAALSGGAGRTRRA